MAIYLLSDHPFEGEDIRTLRVLTFKMRADRLDLEEVDGVIFTSKRAVRFAQAIDPKWRRYEAFCIGDATAEEVEKYGGRCAFVSQVKRGESFAEELYARYADRRLLYLRPKKVAFDIARKLKTLGMKVKEQVLYETCCRKLEKDRKPPCGSVIIFTSPSTVRCFLGSFGWDESYAAVAIGATTASAIPNFIKVHLSLRPDIASAVQSAKALRQRLGL